MFKKKAQVPAQPLKDDVIETLQAEIARLRATLAKPNAKYEALLIERNFWVEQGRQLQNQLQTWQRMYSDLFDQLGRGVVTEQSIKDNLALASEELRQPIATVEAVNALVAAQKPDTQGAYTAVNHGRGTLRIDNENEGGLIR